MPRARPDAAAFLPQRRDLAALAAALPGCRGCELYRHATQAVPGAGPAQARLLLVGEMPGAAEDEAGRAFVGPAGRVLAEALAQAGIDRLDTYVTNAVKHFRFLAAAGRRLHKTPAASHISACRPWLEAEIAAVRPRVIVCLGTTAVRAVLGRPGTLAALRGTVQRHALGAAVVVTSHPAAILRKPDAADRRAARAALARDLRRARRLAERAAD